jgi:parvulin-like peptidyl-prolyl isomerase
MTRALRYALAATAFALLASCGIKQVQPVTPTPTPTPTPVPTVSISGGSVAAIVGGTKVPMSLFQAFANAAYQSAIQNHQPISQKEATRQALGELIEEVIGTHQAQRLHVSPTSKMVNAQISQAITQAHGEAAFLKALKTQGLTPSTFRVIIVAGLAQHALAAKLFPLKKSGDVAQAKQILVAAVQPLSPNVALFTRSITPAKDKCANKILTFTEAKAVARSLLSELQGGTSFAKLVTKCSDDPYSAANHGFMSGPMSTKDLYPYAEEFAPNIERAVFHGPIGSYQLLGSIDGWHIIFVAKRHHVTIPTTKIKSTGATLPALIQNYQFLAWLNAKAQAAYKHTTVYEHAAS